MAENKKPAAEVAEQNDAREPASTTAGSSPRFGRGILIGAAAAALVVGVALGGTGGFALANATAHDRGPAAAEQGGMPGGHQQQGPGDGRPPQGGPGGGQNGPQGQPGNGAPGSGQQGQGQPGPGQNGQNQNGQNQNGQNQNGQNQNTPQDDPQSDAPQSDADAG